MIASKYEILITDGSKILRRYNFDLEAISIYDANGDTGAIFYYGVKNEILIHTIGEAIYVYDSFFYKDFYFSFDINDDVLFHRADFNFIFFVKSDSTIGKLDIWKEKYELRSKVCSVGARVVAFYAHKDESLMTVCTYSNQNSTSEIILSNYGNTNRRNITLRFRVKSVVLTSNGKILASIQNYSDNSSSLINLF
jgi:hypothetical protein